MKGHNYGFCRKCRKEHIRPMQGKHHTEKTKRRIGLANTARPNMMGGNNPAKRPEVRKKISLFNKGKHLSNETKSKLSIARKGKPSPMKGKHHSEQTRKRLSEKAILQMQNPKMREQLSEIKMKQFAEGKFVPWNKGKKGLQKHTEDAKKSMSLAHLGRRLSEETKRKLSEVRVERGLNEKQSELAKKLWQDLKFREKHSEANKKMWQNPVYRENQREKAKENWKNLEYRNKVVTNAMKAVHIKPNNKELFLDSVIHSITSNYKYTGDGQTIINGRCPDWTNTNGQKKVILFNGLYWHLQRLQKKEPTLTRGDVMSIEKKPYEEFGFKVLFIWEDELKDVEKLKQIILKFNKQGD